MNCTRDEFEKKVHSRHPHKWIKLHMTPGSVDRVLALDTYGETLLSYENMFKLASHIWTEGFPLVSLDRVTKDSDGLFSTQATATTQNLSSLPAGTMSTTYHTGKEFQDKVRAKFPNYSLIVRQYSPNFGISHNSYIFAHDGSDPNFPSLDPMEMYKKSSFVLCDGYVAKDDYGVFTAPAGLFAPVSSYYHTSPSNGAYTVPTGGTYQFNGLTLTVPAGMSVDINKIASKDTLINSPKCECGKENHGFARHSNWCPIKEQE